MVSEASSDSYWWISLIAKMRIQIIVRKVMSVLLFEDLHQIRFNLYWIWQGRRKMVL